jgi:hypothetical protein
MQAGNAPGIGPRRIRRVSTFLLALSVSLFCSAQTGGVVTPSDVEAAYLYNFAKFVTWPSDAGQDPAPFDLCILGEDSFGETLSSMIATETHQGRKLAVRRLPSAATAGNCQILFIGQSEESRLASDLNALQKKPILTVSALPGFLEHGGMIQFLLQNRKVRFAVNLTAAGQAGLQLSSELLKVAVHVDSKPNVEVNP